MADQQSKTPKVLENGTLNPRWIGSLTDARMAKWIYDVLHSRELDIPGGPDTSAYSLLMDAYNAANVYAKETLARIVKKHVFDMAYNPRSKWRGTPADELLLVASEICRPDVISPICQMIDSREFVNPQAGVPGDLHFRLLQTLVALDYPGTLNFWEEQARISPKHYLGMAFRGAGRTSVDDAFELLVRVQVERTPELTANIQRAIEGLCDRLGSDTVAATIRETLLTVRDQHAARILRDLLAEVPGLKGV